MRSRRRPAAALALSAATLVLLAGISPAVADDDPVATPPVATPSAETPAATPEATPEPTPEPELKPEPTPEPEPKPEPKPEPTPEPEPKPEPTPEQAPAAVRPTGIVLTPETAELNAGGSASFTVWTVDGAGTRLSDVTAAADFELVGGGGTCTAGTCTTTRSGPAVVKARWDRFSALAVLMVTPGPATGISLRPTTATVSVGVQQLFEAAFVDQYGNPTSLADEVDFTASDGAECAGASPSPATHCQASTPGTYTVTATLRSDPTQSASATLIVKARSEVLAGLELSYAPAQVDAGEPFTLTATARTADGGAIDVTDRTVIRAWPMGVDGPGDMSEIEDCPGGTCTLTKAGRYAISALVRDGGLTDATGTEVVAAAPVGLAVAPAEAAVTAGATQDFRAALVDTYGNRTPVDDATYTIGAPGSCTAGACTSATPGTYTVTATHDGRTATATLQVHPDTRPTAGIARITVAPTTPTAVAGQPATFVVRAYAADGRPLGTVTPDATLEIEGAGTWRGLFGERSLSCQADTCTSTVAGRHTVTAHLGDLTATTTMTVESDGVLAVSGLAPSNGVVRAGQSQTFVPGIMDRYGNLVQVSGGALALELQASAGASCTGQVCGSTTAGVYVIRIKAVNGVEVDEASSWFFVALLTVVPGPTDHLGIDPLSATVPAGESVEMTATAYDEYDNVVEDVTDVARFAPGQGATCTANRCSSTVAGSYPVTASHGGDDAVANLRVVPGPVDRLTLTPDTATIAAGVTQAFTSAGFDAYDNAVGDLTDATTFTSSAPGTCTANACGAAEAGELTVTGSYVVPGAPTRERLASGRFGALLAAPGDTVTGTATLTVTPGNPGNPGEPGDQPGGDPDPTPAAGGNGAGGGAGHPGALPATGSPVGWRHGVLAVLLLAAGAACLRRGRRT